MELPPPPPHVLPAHGWPAPTLAGTAPDLAPGDELDAVPDLSTSRLSGAWRWTLGIGWCVILSGLGALAQAAFLVDADPWWLAVKPLPFALPVAVLIALIGDSRWTLPLSAAAAAVLWLLAGVDAVDGNGAVAVGEAVCAASATLLTVAALLGREPVREHAVPDSRS